jgi:hypothetical protein
MATRSDKQAQGSEERAEWTILVYIAAHNDLDPYGLTSLKQILAVGSTKQVKLAVFFDGFSGAEHFIVGEPGQKLHLTHLGKIDSGDPKHLMNTARWAFGLCPAKRYGLVLWSHGSGFWNDNDFRGRWTRTQVDALTTEARRGNARVDEQIERASADVSMSLFRTTMLEILKHPKPRERAILFDIDSGHAIDTLQLEKVCDAIRDVIGQPIDLLGMDACLMGNLEVAYQLRRLVHCLVASEELMSAKSWPYEQILPKLQANPALATTELAAMIVNDIVAVHETYPVASGVEVAQIALDLSGSNIEGLATALQKLSAELSRDIRDGKQALGNAYKAAYTKESNRNMRRVGKSPFCLADIKSLMTELAICTTKPMVKRAAQAVVKELTSPLVICEAHRHPWLGGIGGLSIYFPWKDTAAQAQQLSAQYGDLALAQATGWDKMLSAYHKPR